MRRIVLVGWLLGLGCGVPPPEWDNLEPGALGAATGSVTQRPQEVVLRFNEDWSTTLSSAPVVGSHIRVDYASARLPQCRGDIQGQPAWSLTGFWRLAGGDVHSFEVAGHAASGAAESPRFTVDQEGELELWFQVTNRWGCSTYDSNFGQNWRFVVGPEPRVHFTQDWQTLVTRAPRAGTSLRVDFDLERLPRCRQGYNGAPTWEILAFFRADGGNVEQAPVTYVQGMTRLPSPAYFSIPTGARKVELWFKNTDRAGCVGWDSQYGANYTFFLD